ncbi:MAG: type II toxin-antitoxin system VapC family toxin [Thermoanaerobaculia bacterium]
MKLLDVNVLVRAFREDAPGHGTTHRWLRALVESENGFGIADLALSGFLRIVTHPRIFTPPTPLDEALAFAEALRAQPNCVVIGPGRRHWSIFVGLCREAEARGNLVPDAYLAALAVESGCEWITNDRDFSRFSALSWSTPAPEPTA